MGMEITADMVSRARGIVRWPSPVLRERCKPVDPPVMLGGLVERMLKLMRANSGIGLAAPQVGIPARMFVWEVGGESGAVVNPTLSDPQGDVTMEEGCLSLPGVGVAVSRPESVTLIGLTASGDPLHLRATGLLARVWQHEFDHLNGLTLAERMSDAEGIANRRALKRLRSAAKAKKKGR